MFERVRSYLFVPGDSEKKIAKALDGEADALILDLEDAVAPANRPQARALCCEVLAGPRQRPLVVRMNALDTPDALPDLAEVLRGAPDGIMLPKCAGRADLVLLSNYLDILEQREGIAPGRTRILPITTETATGVMLGSSFAEPHPRLAAMLWGGEDLAASLGVLSNRDENGAYTAPFVTARTTCLYAAAASGATSIDAVYVDFRNEAGLRAEATEALRDGFTSKAAIHPAQVAAINEIFTPDAATVAEAEAIIDALAGGKSVATLNGRLVEAPHLKKAHKILARATQRARQ